ncbi:hypothetical protein [Paraburkholderia sp.]
MGPDECERRTDTSRWMPKSERNAAADEPFDAAGADTDALDIANTAR